MQLGQDSSGIFQPLPFEVAHALVKTVVLHASEFATAKVTLAKLRESDPSDSKAKTQAAKEKVENMHHTERFFVMNKRTGQLATAEWTSKHITTNASGISVSKSGSKAKAWVMTVKIKLSNGEVDLHLRSRDDGEFRKVRCFNLKTAGVKLTMASLSEGYGHLLNPDDVEEQEEEACP